MGRSIKCYVLHGLKTEDVFAETEFSLQSYFSAPMQAMQATTVLGTAISRDENTFLTKSASLKPS